MIQAHSLVRGAENAGVHPDFYRQAQAIEDHMIARIDRELATTKLTPCPICEGKRLRPKVASERVAA